VRKTAVGGVLAGLGTEATVGALTANSRSGTKECSQGNFLLAAHRPLPVWAA